MSSTRFEIDGEDVIKMFDSLTRETESIIDEEIGKFMKDLNAATRANHPWQSRTGTLLSAHSYQAIGPMTWEFIVDTSMIDGGYNYAPVLENGYNQKYTWIAPQVAALKPMMLSNISSRIAYSKSLRGRIFGTIKSFFRK